MISKQNLKDYGFNELCNFFEYIVDSKINGQNTQCVTLIKEMSNPQKKDFIDYLETASFGDEIMDQLKEKVLELI